MRRIAAALVVAILVVGSPVMAQGKGQHSAKCPTDCRTCLPAVTKALDYLADNMSKLMDNEGSPFKPSIYAIGGLAFIASNMPKYQRNINDASKYLSGYIDKVEKDANKTQSCWPTAFAGIFFSELALRGDGGAKTVLNKIMKILQIAQNQNGGWGHQKDNLQKDIFKDKGMTYPDTLMVVTNFAAAALGLMKNRLQIAVPNDVLTRAFKYFEKSQCGDGSFPYDPSQNMGTEPGRTSGACFALYCMSQEGTNTYKRGMKLVVDKLAELPESHASSSMHILTGALATFVNGDYKKWNDLFRDKILGNQDTDGGFKCICSGNVFNCDDRSSRMGGGMFGADQGKMYVTANYSLALLLGMDGLAINKKGKFIPPKPSIVDTGTTKKK